MRLRCEAGVLTAGLARWTAGLGWQDFEWACGIPGSLGGAAAGNAGAYDGDMARSVERVRAWFAGRAAGGGGGRDGLRLPRLPLQAQRDAGGHPQRRPAPDPRIAPGRHGAGSQAFERQRREKQPTERSCGSVFKNPYPDHAGRLMEAAGLKGTAVGEAQISLKHGNFFVNRGGARAADVVALIRLARERVEAAERRAPGDGDPLRRRLAAEDLP